MHIFRRSYLVFADVLDDVAFFALTELRAGAYKFYAVFVAPSVGAEEDHYIYRIK